MVHNMPAQNERKSTRLTRPKEQQKAALKDLLAEAAETAEVMEELLEDPEVRASMRRIRERAWRPGPPYSFESVASFTLLARSASAMQSAIVCDAPPLSPSDCDLMLSPNKSPHYRCRHDPAHCYDLSGASVPSCP
jgi:hypothetical protein